MSTADRDHAYASPLSTRYATVDMVDNFSDRRRALLWRDLWIALAREQQALGLPISAAQVDALVAAREQWDAAAVAAIEARVRHDVMAQIHHFGDVAGADAARVIHLGATSCFVTDNAELVMMQSGLDLLLDRLHAILSRLADFAEQWADLPVLAYTHFQPAQLTTLGKRACLWLYDFLLDFDALTDLRARLPFRGAKGTTGTQASFLALFDGDHDKVRALDQRLAARFGFSQSVPVSGQTYTRKLDTAVVTGLADLCASAAKMAVDLRLLAHEREVEEPFERDQVGSSAMAYKRNPMRSERIGALARFVASLATSPLQTHATQWMERTLDDSANRRLVITEAFLATDAICNLCVDITAGLVVYPAVIRRNMHDELGFVATENVLMAAVRGGGDRQQLHEAIRRHSMEAVAAMKDHGADNDVVARMRADPALGPYVSDDVLDPARYVGRAPAQVREFLAEQVRPRLARASARAGRFCPSVRV